MSAEDVTESSSSEASSSPVSEATSSPAVTPSESSGSPAKETMLDAVLKVIPANTEKDVLEDSEATAHPEAPTDKPKDGQADASPEDGDEDDDAEPPADTGNPLLRKKIRKLLQSRSELRTQVQQLEALRPQAEIGGQLEVFAQTNDLSGEDVANILKMAAFLRQGDYASFYAAVSPFVRTAQEYLGLALPKDLRDRVAQGHMTESAAKEFARIRMDQRRTETVRTAEQQTYAAQAVRQTQDQVTRSVTAYEERIAASDPDYKAKAASVKRVAQAMLLERGGSIQTVDDALSITKAAYDEVNATIRRQQPHPHATARMPNGNGSTQSARPEPKSAYEAALQGLARARNGAGYP